jgi:diacylglycerol kinase family enzyme
MNIVLVYNPKSGSALTAPALRDLCRKHGITIDTLIPVTDDLNRRLASYKKKGATVVAIGGDGTISFVASLLAGSDAVLAPIPGGTLNHFTKDLGIPQDVDEALGRLATAKVQEVDVAQVNDMVFINNSSIGLYPSSLYLRNRFERYMGKWLAATVASIRALLRFRTYTVTIHDETFRTPFVFIGNNQYAFAGAEGFTRSSLTGGTLSVFIARTTSRWVLFKIALFALIGRAHVLDEFDERQTTAFRIESRRKRLNVSRDGEVSRLVTPLEYEINPKALRVLY